MSHPLAKQGAMPGLLQEFFKLKEKEGKRGGSEWALAPFQDLMRIVQIIFTII